MMQDEIDHSDIESQELRSFIRSGKIAFAGNKKLRIYGTLRCSSGKRMKKANRVFFSSEDAALTAGYRACKKCVRPTIATRL